MSQFFRQRPNEVGSSYLCSASDRVIINVKYSHLVTVTKMFVDSCLANCQQSGSKCHFTD